ncbi:MAG: ribosome maturation factor RimM [Endomicrobia bacterium]|nr:ribosome maturation factor RimM [Endomicrobiia bacterium]
MEVCIGKVLKTKGLEGEVLAYFFSPKLVCNEGTQLFFENRFSGKIIGPYTVEKIVYYKTYKDKVVYILKFVGENNINKVENLKSCYIIQEVESLPDNFFLNKDLMYSEIVVKEQNVNLGKVVDIIKVKEDYRILLVRTTYKEEIMIPFIRPVIYKVDVANKRIFVNNIDGITK